MSCPHFRPMQCWEIPQLRWPGNSQRESGRFTRINSRGSIRRKTPCPSFPCFFLGIPCFFFPGEEFLVFSSVFPFFSRDFRGSVGIKNPCFLVVFRAFCPQKKKERKDREPLFGGFQRGVFVRGVNLNNWGGARTGCNN